jgi:hypothetical protein
VRLDFLIVSRVIGKVEFVIGGIEGEAVGDS